MGFPQRGHMVVTKRRWSLPWMGLRRPPRGRTESSRRRKGRRRRRGAHEAMLRRHLQILVLVNVLI